MTEVFVPPRLRLLTRADKERVFPNGQTRAQIRANVVRELRGPEFAGQRQQLLAEFDQLSDRELLNEVVAKLQNDEDGGTEDDFVNMKW